MPAVRRRRRRWRQRGTAKLTEAGRAYVGVAVVAVRVATRPARRQLRRAPVTVDARRTGRTDQTEMLVALELDVVDWFDRLQVEIQRHARPTAQVVVGDAASQPVFSRVLTTNLAGKSVTIYWSSGTLNLN